jgi:hypothetical protein
MLRPEPTPLGLGTVVRNSLTMGWRGILKIKHNPEQLFDVVFQPIIFTAMFAYTFGGAIAGNVHAYLPTIIPGILVQTVITTSVVTGVQLREDMDKGVFDRFKSLPITRISPLSGALLADTVRYGIATLMIFCVGLALGYRPGGAASANAAVTIALPNACSQSPGLPGRGPSSAARAWLTRPTPARQIARRTLASNRSCWACNSPMSAMLRASHRMADS